MPPRQATPCPGAGLARCRPAPVIRSHGAMAAQPAAAHLSRPSAAATVPTDHPQATRIPQRGLWAPRARRISAHSLPARAPPSRVVVPLRPEARRSLPSGLSAAPVQLSRPGKARVLQPNGGVAAAGPVAPTRPADHVLTRPPPTAAVTGCLTSMRASRPARPLVARRLFEARGQHGDSAVGVSMSGQRLVDAG